MSEKGVVTSTKPSELGTFGLDVIECLYDRATMTKVGAHPHIADLDLYMCPRCGWVTTFRRKEG